MPVRGNAMRCLMFLVVILAFLGCGTRKGAVAGSRSGPDPRCASFASVEVTLGEARRDFTCSGKPIHPALVCEFLPWMSDSKPIVVAVDLLAAEKSDEYDEPAVRIRSGWTECNVQSFLPHCRDSEPTVNPPEFGYQRLGTLTDGTQVLRTYYCMGGSGIFMDLVFVRFGTERAYDLRGKPYPRLLMKVVCVYALGDRDDGEITVLSDRVIAGPSKHRDKAVVIKLD